MSRGHAFFDMPDEAIFELMEDDGPEAVQARTSHSQRMREQGVGYDKCACGTSKLACYPQCYRCFANNGYRHKKRSG